MEEKMINGEIVFAISDKKEIHVEFPNGLQPTREINVGDKVALGKVAPMNRWIYKELYEGHEGFYNTLNHIVDMLYLQREYINCLIREYDEVGITIYMRSEYGQMGFTLPSDIIRKCSVLDCPIHVDILSYGGVAE